MTEHEQFEHVSRRTWDVVSQDAAERVAETITSRGPERHQAHALGWLSAEQHERVLYNAKQASLIVEGAEQQPFVDGYLTGFAAASRLADHSLGARTLRDARKVDERTSHLLIVADRRRPERVGQIICNSQDEAPCRSMTRDGLRSPGYQHCVYLQILDSQGVSHPGSQYVQDNPCDQDYRESPVGLCVQVGDDGALTVDWWMQ